MFMERKDEWGLVMKSLVGREVPNQGALILVIRVIYIGESLESHTHVTCICMYV